MGWRVPDEVEINGVDLAVHGESAYETLGGARRSSGGDTAGLMGRADTAHDDRGSARVTTEAK